MVFEVSNFKFLHFEFSRLLFVTALHRNVNVVTINRLSDLDVGLWFEVTDFSLTSQFDLRVCIPDLLEQLLLLLNYLSFIIFLFC